MTHWTRGDLEQRLGEGPDPERTVRLAEGVLAAAAERAADRLERLTRERPDALERVLAALCGVAPFLAPRLVRDPTLLFQLAEDDLARPRTREELDTGLTRALDEEGGDEPGAVLRRFKYRELARITVRDCCDELVPEERVGETLGELSDLAEALLARALELAMAELPGPPRWRDRDGAERELAFCVLGLGKLGGGELNYSSDVDLVYLFESPPPGLRDGPRDLSPEELFTRLARRFGKLVEDVTEDGFLYRIDLDLRPEGAQGRLVSSSDALADYYDGWAATWEKAAFMKARPVAGDLGFGWAVARRIDPMIYQSSIDFAAVESIRTMKERIEQEHGLGEGGDEGALNVKLGAGGIRDVEFVAQALQLVHGGRAPQVRGRSAPGALRALAEAGVIPADEAERLGLAYRFLRRLENRLQMEAERQTHKLPPPGERRERLARTLGYQGEDAEARLNERLESERAVVRVRFGAMFRVDESERVMDLFARAVPRLMASEQSRHMLADLAGRFADEVERSADPERAMNNLHRFVEGVGTRPFYFGLLLDRPELVPRLAALFGASRYLSAVLATNPQLIEPVFSDPERLLSSRAQLESTLAEIRRELGSDEARHPDEVELAALRLFQQRELVNVGLLDLADKIDAAQVEAALTDIAEVCLQEGLRAAQDQLAERHPDAAGDFLVVGMGKLGSRELGYGSDLDVIFLYDVPGGEGPALAEAQEYFIRLAQKLAWALQTRTAEGVCYEVDARLRPSGSQGVLVTSLSAFDKYHETSAQLWERQALLRARSVAGSARLAGAFESRREALLRKPLPDDAAAEIHRIRTRMETELAKEGPGRHDLKTGRGGLVDVEMAVQLLQLRHGPELPALFEPARLDEQIDRIRDAGLLAADDARVLAEGWAFLQRLSSRLRIVENRSITDLQAERSDLDSVARAMGYAPSQRTGTARVPLLDDYRRHTTAIRDVYTRIFESGDGD